MVSAVFEGITKFATLIGIPSAGVFMNLLALGKKIA